MMAANRITFLVNRADLTGFRDRNLHSLAIQCARSLASYPSPVARTNLFVSPHTLECTRLNTPHLRHGAVSVSRSTFSLQLGRTVSRTFLSAAGESRLLSPPTDTTVPRRFKKKSAAKAAEAQEDLEEDDETNVVEEDSAGEPKEWKDLKIAVISPRLDSLTKAALSASRTKAEELFYEGRFRLNGEKVTKKSAEAAVGDELDVIVGYNANNPDFLDVQRIVIDEIGNAIAKGKITVTVRVWKNLVVENYAGSHKFSLTGTKS